MIVVNRICSRCGYSNRPTSKHCGNCNFYLDNQSENENTQHSQSVSRAFLIPTSQPVSRSYLAPRSDMPMLRNAAADLSYLWDEFYRIRASQEQGSWSWKYIRRHVVAYRLQQKIEAAYDRLEYGYLDAYVKAHEQTLNALLRFRQQEIDHYFQLEEQRHIEEIERRKSLLSLNLEDEAFRRYLARRNEINRFDQTWDYRTLIGKFDDYFSVISHIDDVLSTGKYALLPIDKRVQILDRLAWRAEQWLFAPDEYGVDRDGFSDGPDDLADLS